MELKEIFEYFATTDFRTIIAMAIMSWFFYQRLDSKISNLDKKLSDEIGGMGKNLNNLSERVARIEGMLISQECCMIKNDNKLKKVE